MYGSRREWHGEVVRVTVAPGELGVIERDNGEDRLHLRDIELPRFNLRRQAQSLNKNPCKGARDNRRQGVLRRHRRNHKLWDDGQLQQVHHQRRPAENQRRQPLQPQLLQDHLFLTIERPSFLQNHDLLGNRKRSPRPHRHKSPRNHLNRQHHL